MNSHTGKNALAQIDSMEVITPGKVHLRQVTGDNTLRYYVYVPGKSSAYTSQFVSVHGVSRNAREHAEMFSRLAELYGVVLVAPVFSRRYFRDYQRLGREDCGQRADHAIQRITREVEYLTGAGSSKISLFGFSGGGQFAHRYTMAYPEHVNRVVIGAAGWYTYPDTSCKYPYGTGATPRLKGINFSVQQFLQVPACVLVGQWDIKHDPGLNQSERIRRQQGTTRLERGRRWVDMMNRTAMAHGMDTAYTFSTLPGVDHSFTLAMKSGQLGQQVFKYLFGPVPLLAGRARPQTAAQESDNPQTESILSPMDGDARSGGKRTDTGHLHSIAI